MNRSRLHPAGGPRGGRRSSVYNHGAGPTFLSCCCGFSFGFSFFFFFFQLVSLLRVALYSSPEANAGIVVWNMVMLLYRVCCVI